MMKLFVETTAFTKAVKRFLGDDDYEQATDE